MGDGGGGVAPAGAGGSASKRNVSGRDSQVMRKRAPGAADSMAAMPLIRRPARRWEVERVRMAADARRGRLEVDLVASRHRLQHLLDVGDVGSHGVVDGKCGKPEAGARELQAAYGLREAAQRGRHQPHGVGCLRRQDRQAAAQQLERDRRIVDPAVGAMQELLHRELLQLQLFLRLRDSGRLVSVIAGLHQEDSAVASCCPRPTHGSRVEASCTQEGRSIFGQCARAGWRRRPRSLVGALRRVLRGRPMQNGSPACGRGPVHFRRRDAPSVVPHHSLRPLLEEDEPVLPDSLPDPPLELDEPMDPDVPEEP